MAAFLKAVQDEQVVGPLRRGFDNRTWNAAYQRLGEDKGDLDLCNAGLLFHDKANSIRSGLTLTYSKALNATTKLRAFVALANHDFFVLQRRTNKEFEKVVSETKPITMPDFKAIKLTLPGGDKYFPDEIIQSIVDATEIVLRAVLEPKPNLAGNPRFTGVNWNDILLDLNLGGLYAYTEGLWDDCLWNNYSVESAESEKLFSPSDPIWQKRLAASRFRQENLVSQFLSYAHAAHARIGDSALRALIGTREIKALVKDGRKQAIQLAGNREPNDESLQLLAARLYASEPYYKDLLHESQELLGGASIGGLLSAWEVVSRMAQLQAEELASLSFPEDAEPIAWAPRFAPVLQLPSLIRAVARATDLDFSQAKAIVGFLTYRGEKGQELWAQPLVPVNPQTQSLRQP